MRTELRRSVSIALVAGAIGGGAATAGAEPRPTNFSLSMSGNEIVPGPGDPDGTSNAVVSLFFKKPYTICAGTNPQNVQRPLSALDLHRAPSGQAGPVVATFTGGATDASGCAGSRRPCSPRSGTTRSCSTSTRTTPSSRPERSGDSSRSPCLALTVGTPNDVVQGPYRLGVSRLPNSRSSTARNCCTSIGLVRYALAPAASRL